MHATLHLNTATLSKHIPFSGAAVRWGASCRVAVWCPSEAKHILMLVLLLLLHEACQLYNKLIGIQVVKLHGIKFKLILIMPLWILSLYCTYPTYIS